ncbi:unnamed protein product [Symbiodinium sp. KB8]|nr:unnamed protein product [Symbiodinium sp. KB8]
MPTSLLLGTSLAPSWVRAVALAKSLGWVDTEGHWLTLRWNPGQQALEVDSTVRGVPTKDLLTQLVQMRRGSTEETILRFRSLRHLSTAVKAEWIQFQLVVSLRPDAAPVWSTLQSWIGSAVQTTRHATSTQVLNHLPLLTKLQAWNNLHIQHDVAELVAYLLPRLHQQGFQGSWEARCRTEDVIHVTDRGTALAPVILSLHAGEQLILQSMIDQWHAQASVHALTQQTPIVCLQIPRFIWEAGVMRRDHRSLLGYQCLVHMPIFDSPDERTAHLAPYQVVAMQLHYGARPTSGHYRTAMLGQPKFGKEKVWLSDDESVPQPSEFVTDRLKAVDECEIRKPQATASKDGSQETAKQLQELADLQAERQRTATLQQEIALQSSKQAAEAAAMQQNRDELQRQKAAAVAMTVTMDRLQAELEREKAAVQQEVARQTALREGKHANRAKLPMPVLGIQSKEASAIRDLQEELERRQAAEATLRTTMQNLQEELAQERARAAEATSEYAAVSRVREVVPFLGRRPVHETTV